MKIVIMSMQRILNYGSFMQALALKSIIEFLGHEVEFVDYHPGILIQDKKNVWKRIKYIKRRFSYSLKSTQISFYIKNEILKRNTSEAYKKFRECYHMLGIKETYKYRYEAEILLIGSDEVFNCLQTNSAVGYSLALFGKHNRAKKLISYAASFGSTTLQGLEHFGVRKEIAGLLNKFDKVSVRDSNSASLVKELCNYDPEIHLDPVLVGNLEDKHWREIDENNYLVVYGYGNRFTEQEGKEIQKFADSRGLKLIAIAGNQVFCEDYVVCRPDEVITYIRKADYIITDTFHGSIFSIICHKQFVSFCRRKNNTKEGQSTNEEKLVDMLERVGLSDRLIDSPHEIECVIDRPIDYVQVDEIREFERKRTMAYLKENLSL